MKSTDEAVVTEESKHLPGHHPDTGSTVTIKVNGMDVEVRRGSHLVSELKILLGVGATQELDIVVNGEFKPLGDSERVVLKGGEMFVSHARCGASS